LRSKKIVVVGMGYVGSAVVYTLMMTGAADEIVLIDLNRDKTEGDALDMNHGMSFLPPVKLRAGDYEDCAGAALVILTAGAAQKPGEGRMALLRRNAAVFDSILDKMLPHLDSGAMILVVTNPVDVLTQAVLRRSGLPPGQVFGSGTVLDTARLKWAIAGQVGIDARDVHAFVVGEHGDTEVAAFSAASISGIPLSEYCRQRYGQDGHQTALCQLHGLHDTVRRAAGQIIEKKGATCYGVALAVNAIATAILDDQKAILTVSSRIDGLYGIQDACLSLPSIVGTGGVERILEVRYSETETQALRHSAEVIQRALLTVDSGQGTVDS